MSREAEEIIKSYNLSDLGLAVLGSHSALQLLHGAKAERLKTILIVEEKRKKLYKRYSHLIDVWVAVSDFSKLGENEAEKIRTLNGVLIPHGSLVEYLGYEKLKSLRVPLFGLRELVKWEREDGQDERAYFLEGWNGNGSYTDAKIGRGLTDAKNICISLLGGIQPDKLSRYLHQAMKGNNDGLMQRLQLVVWPDEPEHWQNVDIYPDKEARQRACDILKILADMDFTQYGATQGEYDDRPYYRFSDTGQKVFNDWLEILQNVKIRQEENPLMVEHFGKFRSLMPSLALIFHLIEWQCKMLLHKWLYCNLCKRGRKKLPFHQQYMPIT